MTVLKAKWGKVEFDINMGDFGDVERRQEILSQVNQKTRIPVEKIKILPATIFDSKTPLKDGLRVTVIGTHEDQQLQTSPNIPMQFIEDMTEEQIATALRLRKSDPLPGGLENLGNTCYLNSVVQCLASLPRFRDQFLANPSAADFGSQLKFLLQSLGSADSISPDMFVALVRTRFPQFNQRDSHGHYSQQDAEEFLRALLQVLGHGVDDLFAFQVQSEWKCVEAPEEPVSQMTEEMKTLTCHMGTQLEPVSHLHEGLALSLKETISKQSSVLGRSAQFEKRSGISSLPEYLIVQFARFQWKPKSDSAGTEATKTKIIRKVAFQKSLDLYDLCTPKVKAGLDVGRERRRVLLEAGESLEIVQMANCPDSANRLATGVYELVGAVTHQGRTSDGGHYMAMTKRPAKARSDASPVTKKSKEENDLWVKFDDDVVTETNWSALVETGGMLGGLADSQMAYLLFYAKTTVPT